MADSCEKNEIITILRVIWAKSDVIDFPDTTGITLSMAQEALLEIYRRTTLLFCVFLLCDSATEDFNNVTEYLYRDDDVLSRSCSNASAAILKYASKSRLSAMFGFLRN